MRSSKLLFTILIILGFALSSAVAQLPLTGAGSVAGGGGPPTFYVATAGSDGNPGTMAQPWQTIAHVAAQTFGPNTSILFNGGDTFTATASAQLSFAPSTAQHGLTISSYGAGNATISSDNSAACVTATNIASVTVSNIICIGGGNTTNTAAGILIVNSLAGNIKLAGPTLTGLTISGYGYNGISVQGSNGSSGFNQISVTNSTVHDVTGNSTDPFGTSGIMVFSAPSYGSGATIPAHLNVNISNNTVYNTTGTASSSNWTGSGIFVAQASGVLIQNNIAHDCGANSTSAGGPTSIWSGDSANVTIQYNEAYYGKSGNTADGDGFALDGGIVNGVMQYNYAHDNAGSGFIFGSFVEGANNLFSTNVTARFNISQNNDTRNSASYGSFHVYSGPGATLTNVMIYNNTCYAGISGQCYVQPSSGSVSGTVANNIFHGVSGLKIINVGTAPGTIAFAGNDYWSPIAGSAGTLDFGWNGSTYTSFAAWQTATSQEKISGSNVGLTSNPSLYVPGGGFINGGYVPANLMAYNLQSGSAMIGAGLNLQTQFSIDPGASDYYGVAVTASTLPVGAAAGDFTTFVASCAPSSTFLARISSFAKLDNVNYNSILCHLNSTGDLAHLDFLHVLAAPNSAASLLNLKSTSFSLVSHGTNTFTAFQGYVSNGTTGYLDTQYTPSTAGGNMTLTSGGFGVYMLTGATDNKCAMGATDNTTTEISIFMFTSTNPHPGAFIDLNDFTGLTSAGVHFADTKGLTAGWRSGTSLQLWHNGTQWSSFTTSAIALVPYSIFLQAENTAGVPLTINTDQIAMDFLGDSSVSQTNMGLITNAFMTAYGINTY